jgi:hypothetical protein
MIRGQFYDRHHRIEGSWFAHWRLMQRWCKSRHWLKSGRSFNKSADRPGCRVVSQFEFLHWMESGNSRFARPVM